MTNHRSHFTITAWNIQRLTAARRHLIRYHYFGAVDVLAFLETHGVAAPPRSLQPSRAVTTDDGAARGGIAVYLDAVHDAVHCKEQQRYINRINHRSVPWHDIIITRHAITHADGRVLSLLVIVAYASSDVTTGGDRDAQFGRLLDVAGDAIDAHNNGPAVVLGDFNAHSPVYGGDSVTQDARGALLTDWCAHRGLTVLNSIFARGIATRPASGAVLEIASPTRRNRRIDAKDEEAMNAPKCYNKDRAQRAKRTKRE